MLDDYIIVKVENDHDEFSKKVNSLLEEGYDLNGPLNVLECKKTGNVLYIQGLYFEEDFMDDAEDDDDYEDESEDDLVFYEVNDKKSN